MKLPLQIQNMTVFHDSNESLHKHVDKRILSEEYGGPLSKFYNEECVKQVHKHTARRLINDLTDF